MNIQFFAIKIFSNVYASDVNWLGNYVIILNDILSPVLGQGHVTCIGV